MAKLASHRDSKRWRARVLVGMAGLMILASVLLLTSSFEPDVRKVREVSPTPPVEGVRTRTVSRRPVQPPPVSTAVRVQAPSYAIPQDLEAQGWTLSGQPGSWDFEPRMPNTVVAPPDAVAPQTAAH